MTKKDVDVVIRGLDAFNRGDIEGLVAEVDPAVVWEEGGLVFPDLPPAYHGRDASDAGTKRRLLMHGRASVRTCSS